ncbi:MAG: hypothetical protein ACLGIB_07835 [Actinomycetota bacterium]
MGFLTELLLGTGRLRARLRAALEAEGLVALEEGLPGSIRYTNFKAPGKRFNRKVTAERIGIGISEQRLAVYCRSGRVKLIDTLFSEPRLSALEVFLEDRETVSLRIDYDRVEVPKVSGEIKIAATTPNAAQLVEHLRKRLNRRA